MKIDAHQHFWNFDKQRYSWIDDSMAAIQKDFLPKDLEVILKENKFDGCIAVQADQSIVESEYLLDLAAKNDFIKGVVGWVDLTSGNVEKDLERFSTDLKFKGIRHTLYDKEGEFMHDKSFLRGISRLKQFNFTYDILAFDYQLKGAVALSNSLPEQAFVLDHMGKPQVSRKVNRDWIFNIQELAKNPNVYCKLSGLVTETEAFQWDVDQIHPFLDVVVDAFGVDRLIFGSDWPVCLVAASYEQVLKIIQSYFSEFDAETQQKIFGINAWNFYNLQQP